MMSKHKEIHTESHSNDVSKSVSSKTKETKRVRLRAFIIPIFLVSTFGYLQIRAQLPYAPWLTPPAISVWHEGLPGTPLSSGSLLLLFSIIYLINPLWQKLYKKPCFLEGELAVAYGLVLLGGGLMCVWGNGLIIGAIMSVGRYATWHEPVAIGPIWEGMSGLVAPKSVEAVEGFWMGGANVPWAEWIPVIVTWTVFIGLVFWVIICMITLLRERWAEKEHLSYPLNIPIMNLITRDAKGVVGAGIWKNKFLYLGFIYPVMYLGLRILNAYFPGVPIIPDVTTIIGRVLMQISDTWRTAIMGPGGHNFFMRFDPFWFGVAGLAPLDISFSIWFFYIHHRVELYLVTLFLGDPQYFATAAARGGAAPKHLGSGLALAFVVLWLARHDLIQITKKAIMGKKYTLIDDSQEPMFYRTAVFGGLLGLILLVAFMNILIGVNPLFIFIYFIIFFAFTIATMRMRVESGLPSAGAHDARPSPILSSWIGASRIGARGYIATSYTDQIFNMPISLNGAVFAETIKLADDTGMKRTGLIGPIGIMFMVVTVVAFAAVLPLMYEYGAFTVDPWRTQAHRNIERAALSLSGWDGDINYLSIIPGIYSFIVTMILGFMRMNFIWWPFHPIGYFVCTNAAGFNYAFPFLVVWLIRLLVHRWFGPAFSKKFQVFFIGILFGTAIMQTIGTLLRLIIVV